VRAQVLRPGDGTRCSGGKPPQEESAAIAGSIMATPSTVLPAEGAAPARPLPAWLDAVDTAVIALLNVMLAAEVVLVFTSTMVRALFNTSSMMWVDEVSPLFLVTLAFMGGAVAYGHGQFIAIKVVLDRLPAAAQRYLDATTGWIAIVVSLLIGGWSIPMLIANAEEKTILLGIGYVWMTLPITVGCALFVVRAAHGLWRLGLRPALAAGIVVGALSLAVIVATPYLADHRHVLYAGLVVAFLLMIAAGVPVGFVLAVIGIVCAKASGSGDLMGVVMNAQRGAGGFVFLALPFFILAGFIMDRADVGARIVAFVSSLIGHIRGGLLQVMVVGVYIASCISGSKAADMATVGLPMNRKLEEHGYPPEERAAILAASAAMAESVPPSIALILMGSATAISTGALFIAGILPAALIGLMLMITVRIRAARAGWKATPRASVQEIGRTGRKAILPLMIPVILLGGIVGGIGTPTEVSTFAVLYSLALGFGYRRIDGPALWKCLRSATLLNGMIFYTVSVATVFSWALTLEGITTAIASTIAGFGPYAFLPAVIVITVLMGTMLESFVTIVILAPLLLPVAQQLGIDPLHYGIVMTEAFGIGIILPPIGIALYVACAISGAKVEKASAPLLFYLPVLVTGLLLVVLFPVITTILPHLLDFKH
jgi:tripartite ATP-independent transporter DctM subunit